MSTERDAARGPNARKPYQLLLSDEERARYAAAAEADGRPLSQWIRRVCDEKAAAVKRPSPRRR